MILRITLAAPNSVLNGDCIVTKAPPSGLARKTAYKAPSLDMLLANSPSAKLTYGSRVLLAFDAFHINGCPNPLPTASSRGRHLSRFEMCARTNHLVHKIRVHWCAFVDEPKFLQTSRQDCLVYAGRIRFHLCARELTGRIFLNRKLLYGNW
jgi:hypothetical protein